MKRSLQIAAITFVTLIFTVEILLYPKFSNMNSEYHTAQAIQDIKAYVQEHEGQWPSSAEQLQNKYPSGGDVAIDYSVTSSELIANPQILRTAVQPKSGKFYTYPHYDEMIDELLLVLRESNDITE